MSAPAPDLRPVDDITPAPSIADQEDTGIGRAVEAATRRVPPLWPLDSCVAVNPFMGLSDLHISEVAGLLPRVGGARVTQSRDVYREALDTGRIVAGDVQTALRLNPPPAGAPRTVASFLDHVARASLDPAAPLPSVATAATAALGCNWETRVTSRVSDWAGSYFDRGQALWRSPWQHLPPYTAWRAEAQQDRSPELSGLPGFRAAVTALPTTADALFAHAARSLGLPPDSLETYLHRLLMSIGGWAGYARYVGWEQELSGQPDATLRELLAVRLAWECALLELPGADATRAAWRRLRQAYAQVNAQPRADLEAWGDTVLQTAYECGFQRALHEQLKTTPRAPEPERPDAQLAFCIDVRSEVLRRHLEAVAPTCRTHGFAGFFGFPIEHLPLGATQGIAHCPVLLQPEHTLGESAPDGALAAQRGRRLARKGALSRFKKTAVASFGFVETLGLGYVAGLASDTLGWTRPSEAPSDAGLESHERASLTLDLSGPGSGAHHEGRPVGLDAHSRVTRAKNMLRGMSLTGGFARLVVLAGHASRSVNNPHASGLDCGACGGHSGEPNARVAAAVLNEPETREALIAHGIVIPEDTLFLAAVHDTTTDEVSLCDLSAVPASHRADVEGLVARLSEAAARARAERAHRFASVKASGDAATLSEEAHARAKDWSQVRPEWGLARCASFIVAPRAHTRGVDLEGRSFLHDYDWRADDGFAVLESIMTAPMVVGSWISLQYYGSAVDNQTLGCGNKTLHNVVGGLGVLEGAEGDLRSGLAMQSLHDGVDWVHEPLRLSVYLAAPLEAINGVLEKHTTVRELVDNGWLHLLALGDDGQVTHRYLGNLRWRPLTAEKELEA